ncbi:MAG: hypothetical protein NC331_03500 [Lachnospiraceae bacterium]|nr:hypothetical protein [Lachnospiraceae bacterium]MCM1215700.1 hypothetical protein [Lachnospiraceae bacterium]MCM1238433.1 hypothetical protein [Lachnospiraceae bacterium]
MKIDKSKLEIAMARAELNRNTLSKKASLLCGGVFLMAQYDGGIKINTEINTSQLMNLQNRIVKTADKIASLRAKMDTLKDANVPTEEYKKLQNNIEKATTKLKQLKAQQEALKSSGNMFSDEWKLLSESTLMGEKFSE